MKKKIAEGSALGLKYEIFENTGIIDHIEFRKDMIYNAPATGRQLRVPELDNYSVPHTPQQNLLLKGEQDSIELHNMETIGNHGQELTLFLLTHGTNNRGSYFSSVNHATHQTLLNAHSMREQLYPWKSIWMLLFIAMISSVRLENCT